MFYLGVLVTAVADTISSVIPTDPQNQTHGAATGDTPQLPGDFDHREVCLMSPATTSICNTPPDSPLLPRQSLGQRTMWPLHVDNTITDTPSSEENGHDAAASDSAEVVVVIDEVDTAIDTAQFPEETPEAVGQDSSELHEETPETVDQDSTELPEETPETVDQDSTELPEETPEAVGQDSTELPEEAAAKDTSESPRETTETAVIDDTNEPPVSNSDITALFGTNHEDTGAISSNGSLVRYDTDTDIATFPSNPYHLPSAPPPLPSAPPPDYEELYPWRELHGAADNIDPSEANEINKNPIPDDLEGTCALPPVTEKPMSPEEFNDTYYEALATGNLHTIEHLRRDYPQRMIDPLQYPETRKYLYHPLHIAAAKNQMASLEFLCQQPCIDINALSPEKNTALHLAIDHNNVAVVKFLCLRHDIDVNLKNKRGFTPIMLACSKNADGQIIDALLDSQPVLDEEKQIETALSFSVKNNNLETTKKLLKSGAQVNKKHEDGKDSIFYISFDKASDEISKLLLDNLRDVNQSISNCNARALHLASLQGKTDIVIYLINTLNASKFVTNKYKSMPVHYAAYGNNATTFRTLIDLGCTLDEARGRIEEDFWPKVKRKYSRGYDIDYSKKYIKNGRKLFEKGGTPLEFFKGDIEQMKNHEAKHERTKTSINIEKEKDRNRMLRMQEILKAQEALEKKEKDRTERLKRLEHQIKRSVEQNEKTTDTAAATGVTLSTPSTPEQPAPDSDLSALAYTHQSGYEAMQNEWTRYDVNDSRHPPVTPFTNMDDVRGASAMPAMMEKQLDDNKFQKMYLNAIQAGDIDTLRYLKQARPNLMIDSLEDPKDPNALVHPLHLAALNKQWAALEFLCKLDGININTRMSNGQTVLNLAVHEKMEDTILFLCRQPHIKVNLSDYSTRHTPIISACELNLSDKVIEALLAHRPSLEPNNNQKTALGFSVKNRNITVTEKLLEAGANVGKVEEDGKDSVFYIAFQDDNEEMSELLLNYLPDIDKAITEHHARVLHIASHLGKPTLVKQLVEVYEANRFIENKDKAMPVHYAAHNDHSETLRVLLELGCSLNERKGKIEDDFWRMKDDGFYDYWNQCQSRSVDLKSYNKENAGNLYHHGGTPSEFYGKLDINQLKNLEKSIGKDINVEKNKDEARMKERQKQLKQNMQEKQKQERNEQKKLKKEAKKGNKQLAKIAKMTKKLEKLDLEGKRLKDKEEKLQTKMHSPEEEKKENKFSNIWKKK
ncbi:ankyrin repeat domain-containing protein [Endozoicomonas acroporae]|uniref:ankyrin repeat domain-containing protein n=1 Tax=Endozoicomonas acroporae TaxID=1701104 RepID=UPI0013D355BA|nr:ankyrin repeat domain-containing protein [Endozoicomonas acroporae]